MNTLAHPLQRLGLPPGSFAVGRHKRQRVYAFEIHMDEKSVIRKLDPLALGQASLFR